MLVAYAAWEPHPGRLERREVTGWQAIALAIAAQAIAISIQAYAIFDEIPRSERILTVIVLTIATIQIVVSRPRPRPDSLTPQNASASAGSPNTPQPPGVSEANNAPDCCS